MTETQTSSESLQDQLIGTIEAAQTLVVDGVSDLTERVADFKADDLPDPKAVWSKSFDFMERIVESQRKFGMAMLDTFTSDSDEATV
jgi:hypothetical protein